VTKWGQIVMKIGEKHQKELAGYRWSTLTLVVLKMLCHVVTHGSMYKVRESECDTTGWA
jgi:hypothetical protein